MLALWKFTLALLILHDLALLVALAAMARRR